MGPAHIGPNGRLWAKLGPGFKGTGPGPKWSGPGPGPGLEKCVLDFVRLGRNSVLQPRPESPTLHPSIRSLAPPHPHNYTRPPFPLSLILKSSCKPFLWVGSIEGVGMGMRVGIGMSMRTRYGCGWGLGDGAGKSKANLCTWVGVGLSSARAAVRSTNLLLDLYLMCESEQSGAALVV